MANMFALILVISTLITGFFWFIKKFICKKNFFTEYHITSKNLFIQQLNKKILRLINFRLNVLETISSIFPILSIVLIIRSFVYEPFQIPSGSMMPTLLIGDFILVNKFSYGIKDPIFQKTLIKIGHPNRGDIAVFKYPENPRLYYIKRVIGLPGDKINYNSVTKEIIIYPKWIPNTNQEKKILTTYSNIKLSYFIQTFPFLKERGKSDFLLFYQDGKEGNSIHFLERKETIGNITHRILILPIIQDQVEMYYRQFGQKLATWIVPSGQYFVMGDNRDNSLDSRYWGFVPERNMIGKAIIIWMSFEKQEGQWPTGIRFNRVGRIY